MGSLQEQLREYERLEAKLQNHQQSAEQAALETVQVVASPPNAPSPRLPHRSPRPNPTPHAHARTPHAGPWSQTLLCRLKLPTLKQALGDLGLPLEGLDKVELSTRIVKSMYADTITKPTGRCRGT